MVFRDSSAVEQSAVNRSVVGSSPTRGAILILHGSFMAKDISLCLISCGSKIALVKNSWGWSLPGGKINDGEAPEAAAIREVQEETGLTISSPVFVGQRTSPDGARTNHYFTAEVENTDPLKPENPNEIEKAIWVEAKDAKLYLTTDIFLPIQAKIDSLATLQSRINTSTGNRQKS